MPNTTTTAQSTNPNVRRISRKEWDAKPDDYKGRFTFDPNGPFFGMRNMLTMNPETGGTTLEPVIVEGLD